ncbi:MAG: terminase small subunit [Gemmatimonadales bacterium]|nr:terminase small subunit [Gemmatimonadales bacterium]
MRGLPGAQPKGRVSAKKKAKRAPKRRSRATTAKKASKIIAKLDAPAPAPGSVSVESPSDSRPIGVQSDGDLTPKESRFGEEYLVDLNATQAAIRAGYSEKTARQIGYENLTKPHIIDAIARAMQARSERTRVTQDRVITGIAELAFYDVADLFDENGGMRSVHELSPMLRRAIAGIEVTELFADVGGQRVHVGHLKKVKLADRKGNLELLGRHLKLFTDRVEHEAGASLEQILARSMSTAPKEG